MLLVPRINLLYLAPTGGKTGYGTDRRGDRDAWSSYAELRTRWRSWFCTNCSWSMRCVYGNVYQNEANGGEYMYNPVYVRARGINSLVNALADVFLNQGSRLELCRVVDRPHQSVLPRIGSAY